MSRKKRKQKNAARRKDTASQTIKAAPARVESPSQTPVNAEEVVAAIMQAVAPPLFESSAPETSDVRSIAAEPAPSLLEPGPDSSARERIADRPPPYSDHRAYPRISLAVAIDLESDSHFFSGLSGDVSEGGVF